MTLKECLFINNLCYKANQPIQKVTGIVVHDTGANNKYLKRYVQPDKSQSYYQEVIDDIGVNKNGNHWNKVNDRYACVHAFIGLNNKDDVETYNTLPYNICCWGVGDGRYGSYNYNPNARIQFEICADDYTDKNYFNRVMKEAQEYCAYLCRRFNLTTKDICSHHESYLQGYGGNHGDCDQWLSKFGKDMNWFRDEVQKILNTESEDDKPMTAAEKEKFDELVKKIETLEKSNTIYHYWSELPSWAEKPIKALYENNYFSGASESDLNLHKIKMETLVCMAKILKEQGIIKY